MSISSSWFVESKVILTVYEGIIISDDLRQLADEVVAMIDQSDSPLVHTLIDVRQLERYPMNVIEIIQSTRKLLTHPRYGWMIVFGDFDKAMAFILQTISSAMRIRMRMFHSLNEALEFLESMDSTVSLPHSTEDEGSATRG